MTKQRRGLGRGLDALLTGTESSTGEERAAPTGTTRTVPVASIQANPYQPRKDFDEDQLAELAASIRVHGLIQPLIVKPEGDGWTLIAGERRLRASQLAGLDEVPVVEREADPQQMLAVAIIENVQRADLDPLESATAYRRLMDEFGLTQAEVAKLVGKSRAAIANTVRLLGLSEDVRALVAAGHLSEGLARPLLTLPSDEAQLAMAQRAIREGWTARQVEAAVRAFMAPADADPSEAVGASKAGSDPNTVAAARALEDHLGTRVDIHRKGAGGSVVVHFYSEEELSSLYDRLIGT